MILQAYFPFDNFLSCSNLDSFSLVYFYSIKLTVIENPFPTLNMLSRRFIRSVGEIEYGNLTSSRTAISSFSFNIIS